MTHSICIKCGAVKKHSIDKCQTCDFEPLSEEDKAKSLILSAEYEIDGEYRGKTMEKLQKIAADIQSGNPYKFDQNEINGVIEYAHRVLSIPASKLIIDGLRWIGPPIAILVAAFYFLRK